MGRRGTKREEDIETQEKYLSLSGFRRGVGIFLCGKGDNNNFWSEKTFKTRIIFGVEVVEQNPLSKIVPSKSRNTTPEYRVDKRCVVQTQITQHPPKNASLKINPNQVQTASIQKQTNQQRKTNQSHQTKEQIKTINQQ